MPHTDGARPGASRKPLCRAAFLLLVLLTSLLAACSGSPQDSSKPTVRITSPTTSTVASYELHGVALDTGGIKQAVYELNSADSIPLTLANGTDFTADLELTPGLNTITVTATDSAGNIGSTTLDVHYQAAPAGSATSSVSGRQGGPLTITGSNFGSEPGRISISGIPAGITSWSDTSIVISVPATAPGGFQQALIETSAGHSVTVDFFVGVEFAAPADLSELAELDLPPGTAVLLGSGTYTVAAGTTVNLHNLSLYGQGQGSTIISSEDETALLSLVASPGFDHIIAGITFETHQVFISPRPVAEGLLGPTAFAPSAKLTATALAASSAFSTQATKHGSVTISSVDFNVPTNGLGLVTANLFDSSIFSGDLSLADVRFSGNAVLLAIALGDVSFERVTAATAGNAVASILGEVSIRDTNIESNGANFLGDGDTGILMTRGLTIIGSSFSGNEVTVSSEMFGGLPLPDTRVEIHNSQFTARYSGDPSIDSGELYFNFGSMATIIEDSDFTAEYELYIDTDGELLQLTGNTITLGHADLDYAYLDLYSGHFLADISLTGNTIEFLAEGGPWIESQSGLHFVDNEVTGHDNSETALSLYLYETDEPLDVTVTGNTFTGFEQALYFGADYYFDDGDEELNAVINNNVFDFPITAAPQAAYISSNLRGALDLRNNKWGTITDPAAVEAAIQNDGGAGVTVLVAPLLP